MFSKSFQCSWHCWSDLSGVGLVPWFGHGGQRQGHGVGSFWVLLGCQVQTCKPIKSNESMSNLKSAVFTSFQSASNPSNLSGNLSHPFATPGSESWGQSHWLRPEDFRPVCQTPESIKTVWKNHGQFLPGYRSARPQRREAFRRVVQACIKDTIFFLGLRDKHRVVAGDFNLEPHAIRHAVDCVIEQFEGASYEVLHGDRSAEICCVCWISQSCLNCEAQWKARWRSARQVRSWDSHYPLILELPPLELREGDLRKRSAEAAAKRAQKKSKRSWTKNSRSGAAKRLTCIDICHITFASIYLNRFLCIYVKFKVSGSKFKVSGSKSGWGLLLGWSSGWLLGCLLLVRGNCIILNRTKQTGSVVHYWILSGYY